MGGQNKDKNFKKRFGDRITVTYLEKPLSPAEQKIQNQKISKAFADVLTGILGREPTPNELLGIDEIKFRKKKPSGPSVTPP